MMAMLKLNVAAARRMYERGPARYHQPLHTRISLFKALKALNRSKHPVRTNTGGKRGN